ARCLRRRCGSARTRELLCAGSAAITTVDDGRDRTDTCPYLSGRCYRPPSSRASGYPVGNVTMITGVQYMATCPASPLALPSRPGAMSSLILRDFDNGGHTDEKAAGGRGSSDRVFTRHGCSVSG